MLNKKEARIKQRIKKILKRKLILDEEGKYKIYFKKASPSSWSLYKYVFIPEKQHFPLKKKLKGKKVTLYLKGIGNKTLIFTGEKPKEKMSLTKK